MQDVELGQLPMVTETGEGGPPEHVARNISNCVYNRERETVYEVEHSVTRYMYICVSSYIIITKFLEIHKTPRLTL